MLAKVVELVGKRFPQESALKSRRVDGGSFERLVNAVQDTRNRVEGLLRRVSELRRAAEGEDVRWAEGALHPRGDEGCRRKNSRWKRRRLPCVRGEFKQQDDHGKQERTKCDIFSETLVDVGELRSFKSSAKELDRGQTGRTGM